MKLKENWDKFIIKRGIRLAFEEIFDVKRLVTTTNRVPIIENIVFLTKGVRVVLDISLVCDIEDIKKNSEFIRITFKAYAVEVAEHEGRVIINIYIEPLELKNYSKIKLSAYELLLGYNYRGIITTDMRITPHILIVGLSNQGKTQMAKTIINNLDNADVFLLNVFKDDFKACTHKIILGNENILIFLTRCLKLNVMRSRPMYIVIDELIVLCKDKNINKAIMDLLAISRHYNIFIVGISQMGTKEQLKFKELFNTRICFRCIEKSSYLTVLGCSADEILQHREFYIYSTGLNKGITFTN